MKNILLTIGSIGIIIGVMYASVLQAAPTTQYFVNLAPFTTNTYTNGDSSHYWSATYTKDLFFSTTTAGCATIASTGQTYSTGSSCATLPTFSPNSIITSNGSGSLIATSSQLTVGSLISTTTSASFFNGNLGIASSSPTTALTVVGQIESGESLPATSTTITLNWATTNNTVLYQMGTAAFTITSTNFHAGAHKIVEICNPNGTAGAITWSPTLRYIGGVSPTQTTTANQCDIWALSATMATSSSASSIQIDLVGFSAGVQ